MFRYLESRVDAFAPDGAEPPPDKLWPYLLDHLKPFRGTLGVIAVMSFSVAIIETGLIYYAGRLVDLMATGQQDFVARHGVELALVALAILFIRPVAIVGSIALLNHAMSTNLMDQVRWRAHRHLLGQSVGFFNSDFAGRIANRVMQTGPAVEDSVYMAFEALWYAAAYVLGAIVVLAHTDERLILPLMIWLAVYLTAALCADPEDRTLRPSGCPTRGRW